MRLWFLASLVVLLLPASAFAQGGPMPPATPPPLPAAPGPYNPDPQRGIQDHAHGQRLPAPAQMQPPPLTLPADLGGRVVSAAERNRPHAPGHGDQANPMGSGHRYGTPHAPMPALPPGVTPPPLRAETDDPSATAQDAEDLPSLRLLGRAAAPEGQDGTWCVVGVIGGQAGQPYYQTLWGEGWFGCSNTYWVYFTLQNLSVWRCWYSFAGWCLPGAAQYIAPIGTCDQRFSQQVQWCGPFYGYEPPATYFIRNETYVMTATGAGSDYEDSGLFNLY